MRVPLPASSPYSTLTPIPGLHQSERGRAQNATVILSLLITTLNALFDTDFLPADELFFDQTVQMTILNAQLQNVA